VIVGTDPVKPPRGRRWTTRQAESFSEIVRDAPDRVDQAFRKQSLQSGCFVSIIRFAMTRWE
jgi:hypothetical protein